MQQKSLFRKHLCTRDITMANFGDDNSVRSVVQKYFYQTTTHGIPAVYFSEGKTKKVVWTIIFLFLIGLFTFNVAHLLSEYFSYPIYQKVRDERQTEVAFPSVTICTASDYSKASATNETLANVDLLVRKIENNEIDFDSFSKWRSEVEQEHLTHVHNLEFKHKVKSEFRPMLLKGLKDSCSFSTVKTCNYSRDFKLTFPSNEDKLCITFNYNKTEPYFQRGNGPLFGLSMVLYVNQSDYVPAMGLDNGIGLTVYIHAVNTYPFLGVHAISVPPGYSSNIAMHKIVTTRLPPPYPSKCTDGRGIFNIFPGDYTAMSCEVSCQYDYMYKMCGSIDPFMRSFMSPEQYPRTEHPDVKQALKCRNKILKELYENGFHEKCNCPPPCEDEVYHHTVSMTKWPALVDIPLYRIAFAKALNLEPSQLSREYIRNNFLQIRVYFDELGYKHVYEQCKISLAELFSNLGGQLGLWIGYSLFSMIELLAMVLTAGYLFLKQKCSEKAKTDKVEESKREKESDKTAE